MHEAGDYDADEFFTNPSQWEPDPARRCDACWMPREYLVEIPRAHLRGGGEPARFRLCWRHAQNVANAAPAAIIRFLDTQEPAA